MPPPGTLVLRHARIHTLARSRPVSALAVRDGRIVAVGDDGDVWSAVGSDAPSVDLGGRVVLPGFTDAHVHWCTFALMRRQLALEPTWDLNEVQRRVRRRVADVAPGQWIVGRGWDHASWGRWPSAADLDIVAPRHPTCLTRKDGHAVWVNTAALDVAGIGDSTPDPPGGTIARENGRATGILMENATRLVTSAFPEPSPDVRQAALVDSWPEAWCRGLTCCHDMGFRDTALFRDLSTLRDAGELGLRFVWYFPKAMLDEAVGLGLRSGLGDAWLRVGGLKLYLDGTLGSQTADMLAPYEGQPDNRGMPTLDEETYRRLVRTAADAGIATATHAIGDAANRKALDGFEAVREAVGEPAAGLRQRIEHAQIVHPDDVARFAELGVIASMQPIHATSDMPVADRFWGDRARHAYAWRTLLEDDVRLAFGSDTPIESPDVFAGIHAAVTRRTADGDPAGGWHPEQRVSVRDAIGAYTVGAAHASGLEGQLGALDIGRYADLIVLDRDPLSVSSQALLATQVLGTMIEGVWVWQAQDVDIGGPRQTAQGG